MSQQDPTLCPRCLTQNACAIEANLPAQTCWCMQKSVKPPKLHLPSTKDACYCSRCLEELARDE